MFVQLHVSQSVNKHKTRHDFQVLQGKLLLMYFRALIGGLMVDARCKFDQEGQQVPARKGSCGVNRLSLSMVCT